MLRGDPLSSAFTSIEYIERVFFSATRLKRSDTSKIYSHESYSLYIMKNNKPSRRQKTCAEHTLLVKIVGFCCFRDTISNRAIVKLYWQRYHAVIIGHCISNPTYLKDPSLLTEVTLCFYFLLTCVGILYNFYRFNHSACSTSVSILIIDDHRRGIFTGLLQQISYSSFFCFVYFKKY